MFEWQWLHAVTLSALLVGVAGATGMETVRSGELWRVETVRWLWMAVVIAVAHQVLVWFCWRTELHASLLTRVLGGQAFSVYAILFSILGIARVAVVFLLAISNRDSLQINTAVPRVLAAIVAVPAAYLFYSVIRYFGFRRAFGIDHFEESCRSMPLVRKGIFRWTRNGMYVYGFLVLWVPALWFSSAAAMAAALFNHLYIWVHYYATELPDMRRIYGSSKAGDTT